MPEIRLYSNNNVSPTLDEHSCWFSNTLRNHELFFEKICCNNRPCGTLRLNYNHNENQYLLSYYLIPTYWNFGIGTISPQRKLHVNGTIRLEGLPTYSGNSTAIAGGLSTNDVYKTSTGELRIVV